MEKVDKAHLKTAFYHEVTHHKQGSQYIRYIINVISCIHFFNPFVKQFGVWMDIWSENACDEAVSLFADRKVYIETILFSGTRDEEMLHMWSGMAASNQTLMTRVDTIKNCKKKNIRTRCMAGGLTILMLILQTSMSFVTTLIMLKGYETIYAQTNSQHLIASDATIDEKHVVGKDDLNRNGNYVDESKIVDIPVHTVSKEFEKLEIEHLSSVRTTPFCVEETQGITITGVVLGDSSLVIGICGSKEQIVKEVERSFSETFDVESTGEYTVFILNDNEEDVELEASVLIFDKTDSNTSNETTETTEVTDTKN